MTTLEKRKVERSSNVLMVNYRQLNKSREYLLGIANNYSHKGISFEAACIESNPGEELELILKNPYSELSISAIGEMVWKMDGWYKCITGIKLKDLDQEAVNKMKGLVTYSTMVCDEPPLIHEAAELSKKEGEKDIVVVDEVSDEMAPETEIVPAGDKTISISNKEVESLAEEKAKINLFRNRTDKPLFKFIIIVLLLVASTLFALKTVKIKAGIYEKTKQQGLSQAMTAVRQPPEQRGKIIFDSASDVISPAFHSVIDECAMALLKDTGAILKVEGYSDSMGPELYNLDLAMRRSMEVKKLLMKKGINDRRIKIAIYGESYPVSSNIDEVENAGDRRVDMVIVPSS